MPLIQLIPQGNCIKIYDPDHIRTQPLKSNSFRASQSLNGLDLGYFCLV